MSEEKKDWHSRICSVCLMRNTEHCNPCVVIATVGDELTRVRAEEAAKYKAVVEAVEKMIATSEICAAGTCLVIIKHLKAALAALEEK